MDYERPSGDPPDGIGGAKQHGHTLEKQSHDNP